MPEYIHHFPEPFLEDLVRGRCLPFVGAGFSLNAKIPRGKKMLDWDGLGNAVASALQDYQYTTALEALSAYSHEFSRVKLVEYLSSALMVSTIQPAKTHEEFCRLPFERVVTTNFDFLLEQSYARINRYCIPLIAEDQLGVGVHQAGVRLLKLHGDLHHPNRLVVTEEDYDAFSSSLPLLATHLASLLIDHTAFFVGYSLDDPDFRQIWQVVKERLGALRRPAYVLQVGAAPNLVARYERRGVKVINLPKTASKSYGDILETVFRELGEYWTSQVVSQSTSIELEPQAELSLPPTAQSRLAFFSVPTRYAALYKARVYPIAERYGFSPVMATEVIAPGDSVMAKVYALIEKAALVVADLGTANTLFEVGMVLSKEGMAKPIIMIVEDEVSVPFDLSSHVIIRRPRSLDEGSVEFLNGLERAFSREFEKISPALEDEPSRLLSKKEYRAAVIAAFSLLEHELRQYLALLGQEASSSRSSLRKLIEMAHSREVFDLKIFQRLLSHAAIRNRIAHSHAEVTAQQAKALVRDVSAGVRKVRKANLALHSSGPLTEGAEVKP